MTTALVVLVLIVLLLAGAIWDVRRYGPSRSGKGTTIRRREQR